VPSPEAIIATEAVVGAFSLATFEVIDEVLLMRGAVVPDSMPLIDTHDPTSVDKLRGRVRNIRIEGSNMIGRLFFGNTPAARDAWQDVLDGNLTDVSTGKASHIVAFDKSFVIPGYTPKLPRGETTHPLDHLVELLSAEREQREENGEPMTVDLRVDKSLPYDQVAPIMRAITGAKITRVNLVALVGVRDD